MLMVLTASQLHSITLAATTVMWLQQPQTL